MVHCEYHIRLEDVGEVTRMCHINGEPARYPSKGLAVNIGP